MVFMLSRNDRGIFLREAVDKHAHPNRKMVVFRLSSREPNEWVPFLTTATDVKENYPLIGKYIGTLEENKKVEWKEFDDEIASIVRKNKKDLWQIKTVLLNKSFRNARVDDDMREFSIGKKAHYSNVCWRCHDNVDSSSELSHTGCGWLICSSCGACGCGYKKA
jgi:hypothetical protein